MVLSMPDPQQRKPDNLEQELARRTRRLSALYTVLSAYHQVDDLNEMMMLALKQVLNNSLGHVGSIHLLDEKTDNLWLAAHQGMQAAILEAIRQTPARDEFLRNIMRRKKPLFIPDMAAEPRLAEFAQTSGLQIFVGVPILSGKSAWGVLAIYGDHTLQTISDELKLLEIIAGQIGIAIENRRLREQAERLAITEERNRLARELHDSVTQSLYSLTLFAETAQRMLAAGDQVETRRCLDEIADSSQQALKEMRLLVHKLRPSTYKDIGLANSIEQRLRAVEGRSGIRFEFQADKKISLPGEVESALYAIVVEALNNALKYARANKVRVILADEGNMIFLEIADNGVGFNLEQARQSGGLAFSRSILRPGREPRCRCASRTTPNPAKTRWRDNRLPLL
jgi:signal transduction histidine kinase